MTRPTGTIEEEGITYETFARLQERRRRIIAANAAFIRNTIARTGAPGPVLDVGVGMGQTLRQLARTLPPNTPLVGCDNDPTMIQYADRHLRGLDNVGLVLLDATKPLPFRDKSFRVVYTEHVCHHISGFDQTAREIHRLLTDDGLFVFIDLAPERLLSRTFVFGYPALRLGLSALGLKWEVGEGTYHSLRRSKALAGVSALLRSAGFRVASHSLARLDLRMTLSKRPD